MVALVEALLCCILMWTEEGPGLVIKQEDEMGRKAAKPFPGFLIVIPRYMLLSQGRSNYCHGWGPGVRSPVIPGLQSQQGFCPSRSMFAFTWHPNFLGESSYVPITIYTCWMVALIEPGFDTSGGWHLAAS